MSTENIVSKKYRILSDVANKVWDVISFFTLAKDVELTNGNNLETTCGSITGITSSLTSTSTTMAASASAIKELNDKIADLNSNLMKSVWVNESPTVNFAATTLNLSSYNIPNGIIIKCIGFKNATSDSHIHYMFLKNDGIIKGLYDYHAQNELQWRKFTLSEDGELTITQGYKTTNLAYSDGQASKSDGSVVPLEIYIV